MFRNAHYFTFSSLWLISALAHSHVKETIFLERAYRKEHNFTRVQDLSWIQLDITGPLGYTGEQNTANAITLLDLTLPISEVDNVDASSPTSTVIDHNVREFFGAHPNVLRLHMSMFQGTLDRPFQQNELSTPSHLATVEVLLQIPATLTDSVKVDHLANDLMKHANAVADANLGTAFQIAEGSRLIRDSQGSLVTLYNEFQDDKLCTENLWRIYKMFPCRSLNGVVAALKPNSFAMARMKSIEVIVTRNGTYLKQVINIKIADEHFEASLPPLADSFDLQSTYPCSFVEELNILMRDGNQEWFMKKTFPDIQSSASLAELWLSENQNRSAIGHIGDYSLLGESGRYWMQDMIEVRMVQLFEDRSREITRSTLNYILTAPRSLDGVEIQLLQHLTRKMRPIIALISVKCDERGLERPEIKLEDIQGAPVTHRESLRAERTLRINFRFNSQICRIKVPIVKDSPMFDEMLSNYEFGQMLTSPYVQRMDINFTTPSNFKSLGGAKVPVPYMNICELFKAIN